MHTKLFKKRDSCGTPKKVYFLSNFKTMLFRQIIPKKKKKNGKNQGKTIVGGHPKSIDSSPLASNPTLEIVVWSILLPIFGLDGGNRNLKPWSPFYRPSNMISLKLLLFDLLVLRNGRIFVWNVFGFGFFFFFFVI